MNKKLDFSRLFLLISFFAVLSAQAGDDFQNSVMVIEVNAANDFVSEHEDAVVLDVRTPIEFKMSHITGSVNVDVQDASFEDLVARLDPNKTYIVHCTKNPIGGRSSRALESMQKLGFKRLYSLEGGYIAWKNAELPLTVTSN
ncbi:MAG: rhodanese-like domain-containing protein [Woeseia sp.]